MSDIKLIALDLDGTLLNTAKELPEENLRALYRAAELGIEIVPATGRFFDAIPEQLRRMPHLHYAITINGAQVYDCREKRAVIQVDMPLEQGLDLAAHLDNLPVIYDCYVNNCGWMNSQWLDSLGQYTDDINVQKMVRGTRQPVADLKQFVIQQGKPLQKITAYTADEQLRQELLEHLGERFPGIIVSSSLPCNIEINHIDANKGNAIRCLANMMGITRDQVMAFGDGLNDLQMLEAAGIGIAMENGHPMLKNAADIIADSCDHNGVAKIIHRLLGMDEQNT